MHSATEIDIKLENLTKEITELKKMLITLNIRNKRKTEKAWKRLMQSSKEISKRWQGKNAVEEIREQREK